MYFYDFRFTIYVFLHVENIPIFLGLVSTYGLPGFFFLQRKIVIEITYSTMEHGFEQEKKFSPFSHH